jgi:hypothetical protein
MRLLDRTSAVNEPDPEDWQGRQAALAHAMVHDKWFRPAMAGRFRDGRPQDHPWLRVIEAGHHKKTTEPYYLLQTGGSGASWWKQSEVELFPDEPSP